MRVMLVGDTHGNAGFWKTVFLFAQNENADLIIQLGDFGVWPGLKGHEYLDRIQAWSEESGIPVWVVPGNHDDWDQIEALKDEWIRPNIRILGKVNSFYLEGINVLTVGGAVSIDRMYRKEGLSWWPQETLTNADVDAAVEVGKVDIVLSHDTTNAMPVWDGFVKDDPASNQNRTGMGVIEDSARPDLWFHGHYHRFIQYDGTHGAKVTALDSEPMGARWSPKPGIPSIGYWLQHKPFAMLDINNRVVVPYVPAYTRKEVVEVYQTAGI